LAEVKKKRKRALKEDFINLISDIFDVSGEKGYQKFVFFLILIDISWFAYVVSDNLFGMNFADYGESAWTLFLGLGLIWYSDVKKVLRIRTQGFRSSNFASLATFVIGVLAVAVSIMSLPQINVVSESLNAVKGILGLIAIVYVILESWVVK